MMHSKVVICSFLLFSSLLESFMTCVYFSSLLSVVDLGLVGDSASQTGRGSLQNGKIAKGD